jgi:hypothetical protein
MQRLLRRLLAGLAVAGIAGGSVLVLEHGGAVAPPAAAHSARASRSARPSARFLAAARAALVTYLAHPDPVVQLAAPAGSTAADSYNWSGYADTSSAQGAFSKVSGTWKTPSVTCTQEDQLTSEWVGLDGWTSATVEQDGTFGWCFEGIPTYFTWYEMYPAGTVEVGSSLEPGDKITASVSRAATSYTLKLTDATQPANSFSESASCAATTCVDTSAEWIAERPQFSIGIAPLADYGSWSLAKAAVTSAGKAGTISSFSPIEVTMIDATSSYNLSTPSSLSAGTAFSTKWNNSY